MKKGACARDEKGWGIPNEGTRSRKIYDHLVTGKSTREIHTLIGGSFKSLSVLAWRIRNPDKANFMSFQKYHNQGAKG